MTLAKLQAKADTALDPTLRRRRPRRGAADLERANGRAQGLQSPLGLLFELLPPAGRDQGWFPGLAARIEVMDRGLGGVVDRVGRDNVRIVPVRSIVEEQAGGDLDVATPDGFHYSPRIHREIGAHLAGQIAEWADTQPHLRLAGPR